MPFYEYLCTACGEQTEVLQKLSDPPETECPACHAPALTKQISAAGFRLKGAGWYETDFKSGDKRNLVDDGGEVHKGPSKAETEAKADAKSDAKSASKSEPAAPAKVEAKSPAQEPAKTASKTETAAKPAPAKDAGGSKTPA